MTKETSTRIESTSGEYVLEIDSNGDINLIIEGHDLATFSKQDFADFQRFISQAEL